jgi:5-methyltetrahydropteroyltriglutamate--homocysteine methyltransferase
MPRIGPDRELKRAVEAYWAGRADAASVENVARTIRAANWQRQRSAGIDHIPSNDFSLYDQMLDTTCLVGALPERFGFTGDEVDLDTYFALARGGDGPDGAGPIHPLEMTKWFDTNYHYLVPELGPDTAFRVASRKPVAELEEALALGIPTRPVLIGPVTYLLLAKSEVAGFAALDLLDRLLPVYEQVLRALEAAGAEWVQFDEPGLATDLGDTERSAYRRAYEALASASGCRLLLATYFGGLGDNTALALSLPVDGVHVDLVRDPGQLDAVVDRLRPDRVLSVGVVDGRNVWRNDLSRTFDLLGAGPRGEATDQAHGQDQRHQRPLGPDLRLQRPVAAQHDSGAGRATSPLEPFEAEPIGEVSDQARWLVAAQPHDSGAKAGTSPLEPFEGLDGRLGDRLWVAPSCSLLHVPYDVGTEPDLDPQIRSRLAFAAQKLDEVATLARGLSHGPAAVSADVAVSDTVVRDRRETVEGPNLSQELADGANSCDGLGVRAGEAGRRVAARTTEDAARHSPYEDRRPAQQAALALPPLPTTTIGSFPQTPEIRRARQQHIVGTLSDEGYRRFCEGEIEHVIRAQEAIGLDVLVHGEPERNDMVQYFGERLSGFATTRNAWVQSYGSRCVRPPILHGDVERPEPMTVDWMTYAQSLTPSPVKGMLTGPVTILQWSFVRDDQPRADTCRQIAFAIRDEVTDLERAGIGIIQVDEPALREGLPLRPGERDGYLAWATECFRLATSGVSDRTQIHTHMCYADFGDILDAVRALDADVISLEAARSGFDMIDRLADHRYPAGVGPGVYDIHAPHVPTEQEMVAVIERAAQVLPLDQLWVNPDCGLKTRGWDEASKALTNMVLAAERCRRTLP